MIQAIVGALVATLLASGAGVGLALLTMERAVQAHAPAKAAAHGEGGAAHAAASEPGILKPLPVVLTNLAGPERTGVRLEGAALLRQASGDDAVLLARVAEDIMALLRTMELKHLEGGNALLALREDLALRAQLRSDGRVRDIIIQALIVE